MHEYYKIMNLCHRHGLPLMHPAVSFRGGMSLRIGEKFDLTFVAFGQGVVFIFFALQF